MEITGTISEQGKLLTPQHNQLIGWFKKNAGKVIKIKLSVKSKKRSNPQNKYYWGCLVPMVTYTLNELGNEYTDDDTHEMLKAKFNAIEVTNKAGISDEVPGSTTRLTTFEFEAYLDRIRMWAAQFLGIVIPLPNESMEMFFDPEVNATIANRTQ